MDKLSEISHGAKVVLGAAIALFVVSFLDWFQVADVGFANMWNGIGVLAGLMLIALLVWQALRLANIKLEIGVTPSMITAALAILLLLFVIIRFLDKPGPSIVDVGVGRTIWAWIGLILAIVLVVGAWMNMQAAGESLTDVRDKVQSMTGGSAAAAPAAPETAAPAPEPAVAPEAAPAPPAEAAAEEPEAGAAEEAAEGDDEPRSA